jgi:branched-chain amino acid transport system permease protein
MELLPQNLVNGLIIGSMYALVAMGLSLIFSIMRVVNMAHGDVYMVGGYMCWVMVHKLTGDFSLGIILAAAGGAGIGFVIERILFRPIYGKPLINQLIVSLGLLVILQEAVFWTAGGRMQGFQAPYPTVREVGNVFIPDQRIIAVAIGVAVYVGIILFLHKTRTGKAMRAAAQNRLAAGMVGIDINRMSSLAFVIGTAVTSITGALLAPVFVLTPYIGVRMTGVAFVIIVTGGMGSVGGAVIASYIIGIAESLFGAYASLEWSFAVMFVIMIAVLLVKPLGLFGRE